MFSCCRTQGWQYCAVKAQRLVSTDTFAPPPCLDRCIGMAQNLGSKKRWLWKLWNWWLGRLGALHPMVPALTVFYSEFLGSFGLVPPLKLCYKISCDLWTVLSSSPFLDPSCHRVPPKKTQLPIGSSAGIAICFMTSGAGQLSSQVCDPGMTTVAPFSALKLSSKAHTVAMEKGTRGRGMRQNWSSKWKGCGVSPGGGMYTRNHQLKSIKMVLEIVSTT